MCGLSFLPRPSQKEYSSHHTFEAVVDQIKFRFESWNALKTQTDSLRKGQISSAASSWKMNTCSEVKPFEVSAETKKMLKEYDKHFKVIFQKDKDQISALISISPSYPIQAPSFLLNANFSSLSTPQFPSSVISQVSSQEVLKLASSPLDLEPTLRYVEEKVNNYFLELPKWDLSLLTLQIKQLQELLGSTFPKGQIPKTD